MKTSIQTIIIIYKNYHTCTLYRAMTHCGHCYSIKSKHQFTSVVFTQFRFQYKTKDCSLFWPSVYTQITFESGDLLVSGNLLNGALKNAHTGMKWWGFVKGLNCVNSTCEAKTPKNKPERTHTCWTALLSSWRSCRGTLAKLTWWRVNVDKRRKSHTATIISVKTPCHCFY